MTPDEAIQLANSEVPGLTSFQWNPDDVRLTKPLWPRLLGYWIVTSHSLMPDGHTVFETSVSIHIRTRQVYLRSAYPLDSWASDRPRRIVVRLLGLASLVVVGLAVAGRLPSGAYWRETFILVAGVPMLLVIQEWWLPIRLIPSALVGFVREDLKEGWQEGTRICFNEWINGWLYEGTAGAEPDWKDGAILTALGVAAIIAWNLLSRAVGVYSQAAATNVAGAAAIWVVLAFVYFYRRVPHSLDS